MSDKPLAERWDDDARREDWPENGDFLTPQKCATQLREFAAEHLTEQTEPSAEDWKIARIVRTHAGIERPCENKDCYRCYSRAYALLAGSNAERRRIRELLVGKETK